MNISEHKSSDKNRCTFILNSVPGLLLLQLCWLCFVLGRVGVRLKLNVSLSSIVFPKCQLFIVTPCCLMSQWLCFDFVVQVSPGSCHGPCGDSVAIAPVAVAVLDFSI